MPGDDHFVPGTDDDNLSEGTDDSEGADVEDTGSPPGGEAGREGGMVLGIFTSQPDQQPHWAPSAYDDLLGVPAGDGQPEAAVAAPAASLEQAAAEMDTEAEPPPPLHLLVRLPSGRMMPVNAPSTASVADLKGAVLTRCAWPAEAVARAGLALADMALAEARSLAGNGVEDGDTLVVFERNQ